MARWQLNSDLDTAEFNYFAQVLTDEVAQLQTELTRLQSSQVLVQLQADLDEEYKNYADLQTLEATALQARSETWETKRICPDTDKLQMLKANNQKLERTLEELGTQVDSLGHQANLLALHHFRPLDSAFKSLQEQIQCEAITKSRAYENELFALETHLQEQDSCIVQLNRRIAEVHGDLKRKAQEAGTSKSLFRQRIEQHAVQLEQVANTNQLLRSDISELKEDTPLFRVKRLKKELAKLQTANSVLKRTAEKLNGLAYGVSPNKSFAVRRRTSARALSSCRVTPNKLK